MAQQTLNDGVSFGEQRSKINSNFTELYSTKTDMSDITTAVSAHVAASDPHGVTYPITPGGYSVNITDSDLNSLYRTGFFRGSGLINAPAGDTGWWHVLVQSHDAGSVKQIATSYSTTTIEHGLTYERVCIGWYWQPWAKVYKEGTAIGQTTPAAGAFTTLSASGSIFTSSGIDINSPAGGTWSNYTAADGSLRWYKAGDKLQLSSIGLALDGSLSTTQGATFGGSVATDTGLVLNEEFSSLSTRWITGGYFAASNSGHGARIGFESNANSFASAAIVLQYANGVGNWTEMARFDKGNLSVAGNLTATGRLTTAGIKEDASGNLGVGVTASPFGYAGWIQNPGTGLVSKSDGQHIGSNSYFDASWKYAAADPAASSLYVQGAGEHRWLTAPTGTAGQPINFTQAMSLDASGNLLVGTTTTGGVGLTVAYDSSGRTSISNTSFGGGGFAHNSFRYNGVQVGSITTSSTNATYNTTSDHRLKENIRPANAGRFNDIKFVDFEWIDGRHDCGVIAHQLQEIYPDLVIGEKDATENRKVEITPAVPAVTEQKLVSEAIFNEDGEEIEPAVYETIEITPAVEAVFEDQEFPVYQQVNYIGLIGRIGTRIQMLDKLATEQAEIISKLEARLSAIEDKLN